MTDINHKNALRLDVSLQLARKRCSALKTLIISRMSDAVQDKIMDRGLTADHIAADYILRRWDFLSTHEYKELNGEIPVDQLESGLGLYKELIFDAYNEIIIDIKF